MNKQTAVEWLEQEFIALQNYGVNELGLFAKAKEMEKQQLINFTDDYVDNCVIPNDNMAIPTLMDVPQYYNQTFNK